MSWFNFCGLLFEFFTYRFVAGVRAVPYSNQL